MALQIGRFSFRGPFKNLDEIKNRPGLFILHKGESNISPIVIKETPLLNASIVEELNHVGLVLGEDCFVSVYNTFCALALDREEMVKELMVIFQEN